MLAELFVLFIGLFIGHFSSQWLSLKYPLFSLSNKGFLIMTEMKCKKLWHKMWGTTPSKHSDHHHHHRPKQNNNANHASDLPDMVMNNLPEMLALFQSFMTAPNSSNSTFSPPRPEEARQRPVRNMEIDRQNVPPHEKIINVKDDDHNESPYNILPSRKPLRKPSHFLLREDK